MTIVSDTVGGVHVVDFRASSGKPLGSMKGIAGAVTDMQVLNDASMLATVGLDRYLRVFNWKTRKLQHKVYLKQRLSSVYALALESPTVNDNDNEEDKVWEEMETVGN